MTKEFLQQIAQNYLQKSLVPNLLRAELLNHLLEAIQFAREEYRREDANYKRPDNPRPQAIRAYPETSQMLTAISAISRSLQLHYEKFTEQHSGIAWQALSNMVQNINSSYKPVHGLGSNVIIETHVDYKLACQFAQHIAANDLQGLETAITNINNHKFFTQLFPIALTARKVDEFLSSEKQLALIKDSGQFLQELDIGLALTNPEGCKTILRHIAIIGEAFSALEDGLQGKFDKKFVDICREIRNVLDHAEEQFLPRARLNKMCIALKDFSQSGNLASLPKLQELLMDQNQFELAGNIAKGLMGKIHGYQQKPYNITPHNPNKRHRIDQEPEEDLSQANTVYVSTFPPVENILQDQGKYLDYFYQNIVSGKGSLSAKIDFLFQFQEQYQKPEYKKIFQEVAKKLIPPIMKDSGSVSLDGISETLYYLYLFKDNTNSELVAHYGKVQEVYNFKIKKLAQGKCSCSETQRQQYLQQYLAITNPTDGFIVANPEITTLCNNPLPIISQTIQPNNLAQQKPKTDEQLAAENLQALIENCRQAIFYRDQIARLFRQIEPRAAHHLGLLNQYLEGRNLLRELGGERFIFQNNFGRDQVDEFKQFFEGLNEQQKQKVCDLSIANLNHKANESLQARGLELMSIPVDFIILTPIPNLVAIDISINQTQVNFLHCSKEYHVINAGSHARALQDNSYFMQKTTDEIKEILDSSLRVSRGYLAHNATTRLGAEKEREAHSSKIDSQIEKMQHSVSELSRLLGEINIDLICSGISSLSIDSSSPRTAPQPISTTRAATPNIEQQLP